MLILHAFKEGLQSLENHTLRTLSMGFGVLWAIFILVLLLGIGNGLHNGVSEAFAKYGTKTMLISKGRSGGTNHPIPLDMVTNLSRSFQAIEHISPILIHKGVIHYEKKQVYSSILGCDPSYALLAHLPMQAGRFFTPRDTLSTNDVCVIGIQVKEKLFGSASAIGKYIFLGDIGLQVVGVLDTLDASFYRESDALLVTSNLFKKLLPKESHYVNAIRLTLLPTTADATVEEQFRAYFARHLHFDIKDKQGLHIFNLSKHAATFHDFFKNISIFNAVVGICLLITGIVSMSNMMLVTIRERQQEMAIRRVLGSRAIEIVAMILSETAIVTLLAGAVGFGAGFALIQLLNKWVVPLSKAYYLSTLTCPTSFIFGGLGLMGLASCLAGIVPAMRAVKIKPVEALGSK